ncbi:RING finger protein 10 [Linum perenne]
MSILPIQTQGSDSSSSFGSPALTSDPDYGSQLSPSSPPPSRQFRSVPLSDSHSPISPVSGPLGLDGEAFVSGSSEEVTEQVTPTGDVKSFQHSGQTSVPYNSGAAQPKGRTSENGALLPSERNNLSTNSQGGSSHSSGRRTQMMNANHLLNFHYDPITRSQPRPAPRRHHQKIKPYNKDLFLQANFKFVVLDTGDNAPESLDPDKMLRWEDIICVRYSTSVPLQCPICLEHPLCPQITSCGHIFCFPCIIRYLLTGQEDFKGDSYKRCPLCFMMVSQKDLYTVSVENVKQYNVGETIDFMLLTRQKDSFTPSERNKQESDSTLRCNEDATDPYAKFVYTSDVELSVRDAVAELDNWLARADSGLVDDLEKLPYVCAAMEQLEQRRKYWNELRACDSNKMHKPVCNHKGSVTGTKKSSSHVDVNGQAKLLDNMKLDSDESLEEKDVVVSSSHGDGKSIQQPPNGSKDIKDSYNFYQAVDGQHFILHPFNMKCLLQHYGSYGMLPDRIKGKILQLEPMTQTEAMRRRYRYLSHFSLTTTVQLCEIDMSEILPPDGLSPFRDEIKKRERLRKQQADKDRKEKIKSEAAGAYDISLVPKFEPAFDHAPLFSLDDFGVYYISLA